MGSQGQDEGAKRPAKKIGGYKIANRRASPGSGCLFFYDRREQVQCVINNLNLRNAIIPMQRP